MKNIDFGDKLAKTGQFVKDNQKPLMYLGGAIALTIIGVIIVKRVSGGLSNVFKDRSINEKPFSAIEVDTAKTTISDSVAETFANQLYGAMKNSGTQEDTIYQILLKLQKPDDFRKVYNAFGRKSYVGSVSGGSPTKLDAWLGWYDNFDLIEWFKNEVGFLNYPTYSLIKKTVTNAGLAY